MRVAIIGGGAAGFFAAISAKTHHPNSEVFIYEKSSKLLAKVKVSGGGRCNVTNGNEKVKNLLEGYPRGFKLLKNGFQVFDNKSTQKWFSDRGVSLKTEADLRVFPVSDSSQSIIDCLMTEVNQLGIKIEMGIDIHGIKPVDSGIQLIFKNGIETLFNKVIIATGGSPKLEGFDWLSALGHKIQPPVPSLFTFNMPNENIKNLMGLAVNEATVTVQGTKLTASGPLLITHWGMSGPAVLKLSSFGARNLSELSYHYKIQVNWSNLKNQELATNELQSNTKAHQGKILSNFKPFGLPERLWLFLLKKSELPIDKKWGELGKKGINKLVNTLTNDVYEVKGKTTFKEEFVTCGGVNLENIDAKSMQSLVCPNLYFAGEVLDIDGITGGYNFQAAWTTGFIAGQLI